MVINLNVQCNGGFLHDILQLTQAPIVVWFDGLIIVYYYYLFNYVLSCIVFCVWWPGMAINVSVQYNGGSLPDIILLTQGYYHWGTYLNDMLLLFLTFSVLVANPKKLLYTVANPACGLLNREKRTKEKVWQHTPPHPPHCWFGGKINKNSRDASTGATQVSVGLTSVQGFLRLVD